VWQQQHQHQQQAPCWQNWPQQVVQQLLWPGMQQDAE
jgi:hypothetical protein